MSREAASPRRRQWLLVLAGAAYLIGLVLSFHLVVYATDLAIAPANGSPCNSLWGPTTCISQPAVLAATFFPALALAMVTWYLGHVGATRWVVIVLLASVVSTAVVVVTLRPRCTGGLTLGIVSDSGPESTSYHWDCLGGIK